MLHLRKTAEKPYFIGLFSFPWANKADSPQESADAFHEYVAEDGWEHLVRMKVGGGRMKRRWT
jgi:hypothetical protein